MRDAALEIPEHRSSQGVSLANAAGDSAIGASVSPGSSIRTAWSACGTLIPGSPHHPRTPGPGISPNLHGAILDGWKAKPLPVGVVKGPRHSSDWRVIGHDRTPLVGSPDPGPPDLARLVRGRVGSGDSHGGPGRAGPTDTWHGGKFPLRRDPIGISSWPYGIEWVPRVPPALPGPPTPIARSWPEAPRSRAVRPPRRRYGLRQAPGSEYPPQFAAVSPLLAERLGSGSVRNLELPHRPVGTVPLPEQRAASGTGRTGARPGPVPPRPSQRPRRCTSPSSSPSCGSGHGRAPRRRRAEFPFPASGPFRTNTGT